MAQQLDGIPGHGRAGVGLHQQWSQGGEREIPAFGGRDHPLNTTRFALTANGFQQAALTHP